jgi:hypothetical protein
VDPRDADRAALAVDLDVEVTAHADREVVLADLEVLRHVGIEVVLPVEQRVRRDLTVEREPDPDDELDRPLVRDGKRAGQAETHGTDVRVRRRAEAVAAAAEHLRRRRELDVTLQADDGLVVGHDALSLPTADDPAPVSRAGSLERSTGMANRRPGPKTVQSRNRSPDTSAERS